MTRGKVRVTRRLVGDTRGAELLEALVRVAFIALPLLAVFLSSMKTIHPKRGKDAGPASGPRAPRKTVTRTAG